MSIYSDDLAFVGRVLEAAFATAQIQYDLIFLKRPQNLVHYMMLHKAATADVSFGGRRGPRVQPEFCHIDLSSSSHFGRSVSKIDTANCFPDRFLGSWELSMAGKSVSRRSAGNEVRAYNPPKARCRLKQGSSKSQQAGLRPQRKAARDQLHQGRRNSE
jgi:hypothetical protein